MKEKPTGTVAFIHLAHLKHNIALVRRRVGPERKICLPVKADAYGHGMLPIARASLEYGCDCLSVARTGELEELRRGGVDGRVLVMGHVPREELGRLIQLKGEPFAGSLEYIETLEEAHGGAASDPVGVHLKVDTGMGRIGCPPREALGLARRIIASDRLALKGLCTHFPVSDETDASSLGFTRRQTAVLEELAREIRRLAGCPPFLVHGANSGALALHESAYFDMIRPGILLYGYEPVPTEPMGLLPLMEFSSEIVFLKRISSGETISYGRTWRAERETWIGTIPAGYGDGYSRLLSNRGRVFSGGRVYPVAGRVCMDQIMVDLGPGDESGPAAGLGDRVTLFGPPPCPFSAADIAREMGTIPYEVCCLISTRVERKYLGDSPCLPDRNGLQ